jgi:hypothetical protein
LKAHSGNCFGSKEVILLRRNSGLTEGSRYGYAVVNLGKLDRDEYEDFAVGSPFEANGAVYIYFGSRNFWHGKQGITYNSWYHTVI